VFSYISSEHLRHPENSFLFVGFCLFIGLIIRGSTYYALLYFSIFILINFIIKLNITHLHLSQKKGNFLKRGLEKYK